MPDPTPSPGAIRAICETFPAATIHAGRAKAERRGVLAADIDTVTTHDRRLAPYMLSQFGSGDTRDQRAGEFGLRRLVGSMQSDAA